MPHKVIFLPGLGCSKLRINGHDLVPTIEGGIMDLRLDSCGNDVDGNVVEAKSILLDISSNVPVYGPLVNFFKNQGFVFQNAADNSSVIRGNALCGFPYDFRKDIRLASVGLERFVTKIKEESKTDDVVIISHSMGNLVALDCILNHTDFVSKLVCIAPPFDGVPQVYASLNYGTEFPLPKTNPIGLEPKEFQALIVNWQGLYQLFPFNHYDDERKGFYSKQNKTFSLRETYEKSESLNQNLVSEAKLWKDNLVRKWEKSDFENIYLISGELTENKTICKITEDNSSGTRNVSYGMCAGDGTIPKTSYEKISPDSNLKPIANKYACTGINAEHNALTQNPQVLEKIFSIIS